MTQEDRLSQLPSFRKLNSVQQNAVRLHLLYDIPGPKACSLAGDAHPSQTWGRQKIQRVLSDWNADIDARLAELDDSPTPPPEAPPRPQISNSSEPEPKPAPVAPPPCACGKRSVGSHNGDPVCPSCMLAHCGIRPDGTPLPPPEPEPPAAAEPAVAAVPAPPVAPPPLAVQIWQGIVGNPLQPRTQEDLDREERESLIWRLQEIAEHKAARNAFGVL